MPPAANEAAWGEEPKGALKISTAPYNAPLQDEIVIKVWRLHIYQMT